MNLPRHIQKILDVLLEKNFHIQITFLLIGGRCRQLTLPCCLSCPIDDEDTNFWHLEAVPIEYDRAG